MRSVEEIEEELAELEEAYEDECKEITFHEIEAADIESHIKACTKELDEAKLKLVLKR